MLDKRALVSEQAIRRISRNNDQKPFLSVVMPVHEGAEWIGATLDSLVAEQKHDFEVIVIDSSPTTATKDIVNTFAARLPLRFLRRPDLVPWQTKTNLGVELAATDHVCILHQDDLWLPGRAEAVRRWIRESPEAPLHFGPTLVIDRHGRKMGRWNCPLPAEKLLAAEFVLERLLVQNFVAVPATVFLRNAWLACGGMDESLWYTPDWDIWAKLVGTGPAVYHKEPTTAFRVHGSSLTMTGSRDIAELHEQMRIVVDRHLPRLQAYARRRVERAARTSIDVNVSLAAASAGSVRDIWVAITSILLLGPADILRYLRDSRLRERVMPRVRAKLAGVL